MRYRNLVSGAGRLTGRLGLALAFCGAALPAFAAADWDIVGLKIGMTEAEVRAAMAAYAPDGKLFDHRGTFGYSDGISSHRTEPFLDQIELRVTDGSIKQPLRVWFSGPTGEPRAIAISRQELNLPNPITVAEFQQNLQAKYGPPTGETPGSALYWEESGKPSCIRESWGIAIREFGKFPLGQVNVSQAMAGLARDQPRSSVLPADLETCGTFVFVTISMDPVRAFSAGLYDVGAMAATFNARNAWVEGLTAEATRKRQGQSQAPRL